MLLSLLLTGLIALLAGLIAGFLARRWFEGFIGAIGFFLTANAILYRLGVISVRWGRMTELISEASRSIASIAETYGASMLYSAAIVATTAFTLGFAIGVKLGK